MSQYIYLWDTAQFPDLKAGADSSLKQAKKDFERLKTTPVDTISPNILELGKRLTAEATTLGYSDVFTDSYLNAENDIAYQPKFGAVAIAEPDTSALDPFEGVPIEALFNSELLRVIRPIAKELGLVIYDIRGGVYYPDGSIYPAKLAKAVEKKDQVDEQLRQNASIYRPNAELPNTYKEFEKLAIPFIHDCMIKNGYTPYSPVKPNKLPSYYKQFKHHRVIINMDGYGSYGDFKLTANLYYMIPEFDKYYEKVNSDHVQKVRDSSFQNGNIEASVKLLTVFMYLRIEGLQKEIKNILIATLQRRLDEINANDTLDKLFEVYHQQTLHDVKYGNSVSLADRKIVLAKLANRSDFAELLEAYQGYVNDYSKEMKARVLPNWQKTLAILDTVEPIE